MKTKTIYTLVIVFLGFVWLGGVREASAEKYKLTSKDPTAPIYGNSLSFFPKLRQMVYSVGVTYDDNFYKKGPHLLISFAGDGGRSRDINNDGAVNYYDFIDNILPVADVSNARSNRYKGEGNVYLTNFQFIIAKGGASVKTVSGNLGAINGSMETVFGSTNSFCSDNSIYICIPLDPLGPGDYTIAWNHPKIGNQVVATFTLSGPGGPVVDTPIRAGILIEAENETESGIRPLSERPAPNMKEINPPWRPAYSGFGDWYLASGGEFLKYRVQIPMDALYQVWVRDYVDRFQPKGVRRIIVEWDGRIYGTFAEVDKDALGDRGVFGWHRIGNGVHLTAGEHTLKVTKEATTAGAAIIDAFYLTADPNDRPSEK